MIWYHWRWWRLALAIRRSPGAISIEDGAGGWVPIVWRLWWLYERAVAEA